MYIFHKIAVPNSSFYCVICFVLALSFFATPACAQGLQPGGFSAPPPQECWDANRNRVAISCDQCGSRSESTTCIQDKGLVFNNGCSKDMIISCNFGVGLTARESADCKRNQQLWADRNALSQVYKCVNCAYNQGARGGAIFGEYIKHLKAATTAPPQSPSSAVKRREIKGGTYQISGKDYGVGTVEIRNNGAGRYAVVFSSDKSKLYKALSTSTGSHLYIYQSGDPDKMALEQQLQPSWSYEHKPDGSLVYVNQTGQNIQQVLTPIK